MRPNFAPKTFPAKFFLPGGNGASVVVADRSAWRTIDRNRDVLDDEKIEALSGRIVTADMVKGLVVDENAYTEPRPEDGPEPGVPMFCFRTGKKFIPEVLPRGGNFHVMSQEMLEKSGIPEEGVAAFKALTQLAIAAGKERGLDVPQDVLAAVVPVSPEGRTLMINDAKEAAAKQGGQPQFLVFENWALAVERLFDRNSRLQRGREQRQQRTEQSNVWAAAASRAYGVRSGGERSEAPASRPTTTFANRQTREREFSEWRGVRLYPATALRAEANELAGGPKSPDAAVRIAPEKYVSDGLFDRLDEAQAFVRRCQGFLNYRSSRAIAEARQSKAGHLTSSIGAISEKPTRRRNNRRDQPEA